MELAIEELLGFITSEWEGWSSTGMFVCPPPRSRIYEASGSRVRPVADGISIGSLQALMRRCAKERKVPYVKVVRRYKSQLNPVGQYEQVLDGRTLMFRRVKRLEFLVATFALFGVDGYKWNAVRDQPMYFLGKSQFAVNIPEPLWEGVHAMIIANKQWREVMRLDGDEQACLPAPICTTKSRRSTKRLAPTA